MNTNCELCMFFTNSGCDFGIDQIISEKISKTETGQIINDYQCGYGFGKNTYEENQYITTYEEIKNNIQQKNALNYLLYIEYSDFNFDYDDVVDFVSKLQFIPTALIISVASELDKKLLDEFNKICGIPWRFSIRTPGTTRYYSFVGSIGHYLQTNPDVLYVIGLDKNVNEYLNEAHIELQIKKQDPTKIITFEHSNSSVYITKECFFENKHDWQDIINDLENYIENKND